MLFNRSKLGEFGEKMARQYLRQDGYEVIARNFRCREGEVDVIARTDAYIVFIEVKTRTNHTFGDPCEAVDFRKQGRIMLAAQQYMEKYSIDAPVRFDVVEVICRRVGGAFFLRGINHIPQAF